MAEALKQVAQLWNQNKLTPKEFADRKAAVLARFAAKPPV
jgi:hypothetical protein